MSTRTVIITISTTAQVFPPGTVEDPGFNFALQDANGFTMSSLVTTNDSVSFPLIPVGAGYTAVVSKNGVSISQLFDVPEPAGAIEVPQALVVAVA